jgi:hypothetical protein
MRLLAVLSIVGSVALASAQSSGLQEHRLGLSADRIVSMGLDRWEDYFNKRVEYSGVTRGVSYAVFVDAIREQNGRLYQRLPVTRRTNLKKAANLMKRYSDELGEAEWTFIGGNAFNPTADREALAWAESRMLRVALGRNGSPTTAKGLTSMKTSLANRQDLYARKISQASSRAMKFYGEPNRPRTRVVTELKAVPTRLRSLTSQINTTLRNEPVGVRYEALSALRGMTTFEVRPD